MKNKDISEEWTGMKVEGSSLSLISELTHSAPPLMQLTCPTSENIYIKGAQTWTLQKENNTEWRDSLFSATAILVRTMICKSMEIH